MSSRLTPTLASPKHILHSRAPAGGDNAMATAQYPSPGPHRLPPASVLAESATRLAPLNHLQPAYGHRSPPMRLERLDILNPYRPLTSSQHPPALRPPAPRRTSYQAAAPLGLLLHPVPFNPLDPSSPSSSYASQGSDPSSYGGTSARTAPLNSPTEYGFGRGTESASTNYPAHLEPARPYRYASATAFQPRPTAPAHVSERHTEPAPKPQDITDRYNLTIRQQPLAARACGFGERDRRVIDPPPIVQLSLTDFDPNSPSDVAELRWPFNVVHCSLLSVPPALSGHHSDADVTTVADPNNGNKLSRRLMGTLVASPFIGTDPDIPRASSSSSSSKTNPNARLGCFFIFPDLSCRQNGHYRLRFTLMKVNVEMTPTGGQSSIIGTVESDVFEVFSAKDFPGMRASTALTKELKLQGAAVSVKKGNEAKAGKKVRKRGESGGGGGGGGGGIISKSDSGESDDGASSKKKSKD